MCPRAPIAGLPGPSTFFMPRIYGTSPNLSLSPDSRTDRKGGQSNAGGNKWTGDIKSNHSTEKFNTIEAPTCNADYKY